MKMNSGVNKKILIVGGAGYVGTPLCEKLSTIGHSVTSYDTFWFQNGQIPINDDGIQYLKGNLLDKKYPFEKNKYDLIIMLACLSNDPSAELSHDITTKINKEATFRFIDWASLGKTKKFIYASSSSVYGIKNQPQVTEDLTPAPLTLYSKYKLDVENYLKQKQSSDFDCISIRPATVFGPSSRLRLDVIINILCAHAYFNKKIKVFGGSQYRPNVYIEDLINFYCHLVEIADEKTFNAKSYNYGAKNYKVNQLAQVVKERVENKFNFEITIETTTTKDERSYRINSERAFNEFGMDPQTSLQNGIDELLTQLTILDKIDPQEWKRNKYYNIELIKSLIENKKIII